MSKNFEDFEVFIGNTEAHKKIYDKFDRNPITPTDSFLIAMEVVKLYHEWLNDEHEYWFFRPA